MPAPSGEQGARLRAPGSGRPGSGVFREPGFEMFCERYLGFSPQNRRDTSPTLKASRRPLSVSMTMQPR